MPVNLITPSELADLKRTYLAQVNFKPDDDYEAYFPHDTDPETTTYYRLIVTLEHFLGANMKLATAQANPAFMAKLQALFLKEATDNGFNPDWNALIAWAVKYAQDLFIPVVLDVISGNWAALWALAISKGPQAFADLLAALGIVLAPATP